MLGVVLWSDSEDANAVVWCEDHGELAFYRGGIADVELGVTLDAGDLIQFEIGHDDDLRVVYNPRLVSENMYPGLADVISRQGARGAAAPCRQSAEVIPFCCAATARRNAWDSSGHPAHRTGS